MLRFALAGNPNCGKTTLFNSLTGSTAHVGNWPGVTVDKREGIYRKCDEPIAIVDLPGIYSLSPYTPEEVIARNYVLDEKPDCVINIIDATNLERNLYLTTQLLEIDVPMIIALNMMDAVEKRGDYIDAKELEERLKIPVVKISALKFTGLDELMERGYKVSKEKRQGKTVLEETGLKHLIIDIQIALTGQGVENPLFHAIKLAELDELEVLMHKDTVNMVEAFKTQYHNDMFGDDYEALIADGRYKYITKYFSPTLHRKNENKFVVTPTDKADKVLTHKIWGIPIFLVVLFAIFHLTFSENLLYLGSIFHLPSLNELGLIGADGKPVNVGVALLGTLYDGAIMSPGVFLLNLLNLLTDTLTDVVSGWLSSSPAWVSGLICDGILGGIFAILMFLPQILVLFLFFSILEDSGYMARIAFILDRALRKFGLSGRAFLPMIMGFGCSVPAMINTRTLADEKEKIATVRVIPFFSCGAKLPILTAIAGGIISSFPQFRVSADVITYGMYLIGIITALFAVIIMRNTTLSGETPPFIMELPTYHLPQFKNLMILLWDKAQHFIKKAFTIILASTIVIWFVSHFRFNWTFIEDQTLVGESMLASLGKLIQPIFTPLGFGYNSQSMIEYGWVFAVAAITGLIAKENVVATLGTLAGCIAGEGTLTAMIGVSGITAPALLAFIAFNMTTVPCFAAVAAAKGEILNKKTFWLTILFWVITSFIVGSTIYIIGTWWWTVFIYAVLVALTVAVIIMNKKRLKNKKGNNSLY